ncbi:MAG: OmpA/MotB family protein [Peptoanaerobacter stomatis]|uniref:OmpA/MotB family protein n=1 Tax=Peptoanaerobacter stomatis TaxID=796937 RepID=UPI003FA16CFE
MAKKQVIEEIKMGAPEYMNTYGDMMTLLLCFFVILFSMSNIDAKKFEAIVVSFSGSLGVLSGGNTLTHEDVIDQGSIKDKSNSEVTELDNFKQLEEKIKEYLEQNDLQDKVKVVNEDQGLLLRFQDSILFDQGSASLKSQSNVILKYISDILKSPNFKDKFITVEGHTDNVPIRNSTYSSNWELSVARACNVVRYLIEVQELNPTRLSAAGYSEYHPVGKNDTVENMGKNRRVDIMIMKSKNFTPIK